MKYNTVLERPVWTSKSFKEQFDINLPKGNMNCYDAALHLLGISPYSVFNNVLFSCITHIRNNMLGTTFNNKTLNTYLHTVYAKAEEDLSKHELAILSHVFTEITEAVFVDTTSIGSKIASNALIILSINYLGDVS